MQPTVLVADDDESIRDLLITVLAEAGYSTLSAEDGRAAVALAAERRPDIALLDVMMPVMDGFEACRVLKANPQTSGIPVLLLTAQAQTQSKVRGLDSGATDYITKPFENAELLARLRAALIEKAQRDALAAEALTDALTGLTNRRGLEQQLDQLLAHASRIDETLSIFMFDADRFKLVNDTYGHETGDVVLATLARRAQETVRAQDVLGRFGGEEFLAILPGANRDAALVAAERLRAYIADEPIETAGGPVTVTVSVGVATSHPGTDRDRSTLIAAADVALYGAKQNGRNRVVHADGQPAAPLGLPEPPETARALLHALALVHPSTAQHMETVAHYSWQIAAALHLVHGECSRIALAGLLHDIGKLSIRPALLDRVDPLVEHLTADMRVHVRAGEDLLRQLPTLSHLADLVAAHHEWWDGSGYPCGLRGEAIPLGSRIITVADTYSALRRASGMTAQGTMTMLRQSAGTRFDPMVVSTALRVLPR